jgi:hypothetical protein
MRTIFSSRVLWLGIALLIIGSGPLLASIIYGSPTGDANPNPIGLGMLTAFTSGLASFSLSSASVWALHGGADTCSRKFSCLSAFPCRAFGLGRGSKVLRKAA